MRLKELVLPGSYHFCTQVCTLLLHPLAPHRIQLWVTPASRIAKRPSTGLALAASGSILEVSVALDLELS